MPLSSVYKIVTVFLGLSLRCARWIPKLLTPVQKKKRVQSSRENMCLYTENPNNFLGQIVTGDETYLHHYEPENKRASSQWVPCGGVGPKKAVRKNSAKKVMALVFLDSMGVLLVEFFRKGRTLTGEIYATIIQKLKRVYIRKRGIKKWEDGVYLLHDNAPSHTSMVAQDAINNSGFQQLSHPPYSPDLAPSDYFLFPKLKNYLRGRTFSSDDELERSARAWLQHRPPSFYNTGISAAVYRWDKCIKVKGDYVEK